MPILLGIRLEYLLSAYRYLKNTKKIVNYTYYKYLGLDSYLILTYSTKTPSNPY